ncbi:hypothetical protein [Brevundimonas sp. FT23042]|uniref:hypothetical protein n=1 Tax=Brevundimonas sp. FT23042 TaxID=3393749 RepID=UPI003B58A17E
MTGKPNPVAAFFGWLLMAAGVLIALTAGACSVVFIVSLISSVGAPEAWPSMLGLILLFGGLPVGFGVGLIFIGRMLARRKITRRD